MKDFTTKTVREIALEMPLTTRVFEEYKIDYCCGGRIPFTEACKTAGVDPMTVLLKIESVIKANRGDAANTVERKSMSDLVDYIEEKHHVFTRDEFERLSPLMDKVCRKHGEHHPALFEIQILYRELLGELVLHMRKEEVVLFQYIKQLDTAATLNEPVNVPHFGTIQNPVRMMMFEHDSAGDILRRMRDLSSDYTAPDAACPSFKALYAGLEDLEKDLHQHIHLENNVLFPKAIETEANISMKQGEESIGPCLAKSLF